VAGFEPVDILQAIEMLIVQIESNNPQAEIAYTRGVQPEGNLKALELMHSVFDVAGAEWRGIGDIPNSGFKLKDKYARFDAAEEFEVELPPVKEAPGCRCGEVLRGIIKPMDCKLFRKLCMPENPIGPCMVSSECTCAAYYQYGDFDE